MALLALLAVVVLGSCWYLVSRLSTESGMATAARKARNAEVLYRAKQALIGHIALQAVKAGENNPGRLACPEAAGNIGGSNEGATAGNCTLPAVGRFPWRTFGLDKLIDATGEPLWYVVSPGWALSNSTAPPLTTYINSNSNGGLLVNARSVSALSQSAGLATVVSTAHGFKTGDIVKIAGATSTGYNVAASVTVIDANTFTYLVNSALSTPAAGSINAGNAAVALIIAPGPAMNVASSANCTAVNQARIAPSPTINVFDYLECYDAANGAFSTTAPAGSFNDEVLAITAADVLPAIEAAIANRMQRDITPTLSDVYLGTAWGLTGKERVFPFAAAFGDPSLTTTSYYGAPPATQGLLPFNYGEACVPATEPRCLLMAFSPATPPVAYQPAGLPTCATNPATSPGGCGYIQTQTCNWDPTDTSAVLCDGEYHEDSTSAATLAGPGMRIEMTATITNVAKGLRVLDAWVGARDDVALGAWQVMARDVTTTMNADGSATIKFGATLPNIDVMGWGSYALYRIRLKVADHRMLSMRPREIDFNTGNSTEIRVGQTVVGATSGASGRVSKVAVQSGNWEVVLTPAAGTLSFYSVTGNFVNNENLRVLGVTRARSTSADVDADIDLSWFARNEWYRHVYYATAGNYVWTGSGTCSDVPAVTCLQVANLPIVADRTKQRALLVLMGKRVGAQIRPSANLTDYLDSVENRNLDSVFEQLKVGTFSNDRFVSINKNP